MSATVVDLAKRQNPLADILRLLDLEDQGEAQVQAHSMRAARALFDLKEDTEQWVPEMERRKAEEEKRTNRAAAWSPTSERTFNKWLAERLEESDHAPMPLRKMKRYLYAEGMRRLMPRGITIPQTEGAWRPAVKLYTSGYHKQLVNTVQLAGEMAEREGLDGITDGVMRAAKAQVWKTDPQIQLRGAHPDQASDRDKAIKARNEAVRWIEALWETDETDQIDAFRSWLTDWLSEGAE